MIRIPFFHLKPQPGATHKASMYGVPCYFANIDDEGCSLQGTNVIADLLLEYWCPIVQMIDAYLNGTNGWPIQLRGSIDE